MKLEVLSDYQAGELRWAAGEVVDVGDLLGEHLLRDSPGSFRRLDGAGELPAGAEHTRPAPAGRKRGGGGG